MDLFWVMEDRQLLTIDEEEILKAGKTAWLICGLVNWQTKQNKA